MDSRTEIYKPPSMKVADSERSNQIMQISEFGYSSITELIEDRFYQENKEYHALKDAKTAIDMNVLQGQVRQMAKDRKKE